MNATAPDAKQTVKLWVMGRNFLNSDNGPEGLVEDYKLIAGDFKETLNGGYDAVQFSIEASNNNFTNVTLKERAEVLKGEVRAMAKTVGEVLVITDDTLDQIDKIVNEYSEKHKYHKNSEQEENDFSIGIGVEMQTVGDEDDGYKIKVDIRAFADHENFELEDGSDEEFFEEKTIYFDMVASL